MKLLKVLGTVLIWIALIILGIALRGWLIDKFGIVNYLIFFK